MSEGGVKVALAENEAAPEQKAEDERELAAKLGIRMSGEAEDVADRLRRMRKRKRKSGKFEDGKEEDAGLEGNEVSEAVERQGFDGDADGRIRAELIATTRQKEFRRQKAGDVVQGRLQRAGKGGEGRFEGRERGVG